MFGSPVVDLRLSPSPRPLIPLLHDLHRPCNQKRVASVAGIQNMLGMGAEHEQRQPPHQPGRKPLLTLAGAKAPLESAQWASGPLHRNLASGQMFSAVFVEAALSRRRQCRDQSPHLLACMEDGRLVLSTVTGKCAPPESRRAVPAHPNRREPFFHHGAEAGRRRFPTRCTAYPLVSDGSHIRSTRGNE